MNKKQSYKVARKYKLYILSCIFDADSDCYFTDKDKALNHFNDTFHSEYGYMIERVGPVKALKEYLQGLPSCINIDFMNHDIIERAKLYGSLSHNATNKEIDKLLNNYFNYMANKLNQMLTNSQSGHQPTQTEYENYLNDTANGVIN